MLTVYAAGYFRTRAAAERFDGEDVGRRRATPVVAVATAHAETAPTRAPAPDSARRQVTVAVAPPVDSALRPEAGAPGEASKANPPGTTKAGDDTAAPRAASRPQQVTIDHVTSKPARTADSVRIAGTAPASRDSAAAPAHVATAAPVTASGSTSVSIAAATSAPVAGSAPAPVAASSVADTSSAPSSAALTQPADSASTTEKTAPQLKDGTYYGWGSSRHGDIQASVVIEGGRITSATIAQCLTRYSCSWISRLPPQVVQRQSPEVDYVSGATQSTNAFYYAVVDALAKAK